jgi:TolB protein
MKRLTDAAGGGSSPAWSPDGSRIAFASGGVQSDIHVMDADGTGVAQLTDDPGHDGAPSWSPDGTKIAFISNRSGNPLVDGTLAIYVMNADGTGVEQLTNDAAYDAAWSPAGVAP